MSTSIEEKIIIADATIKELLSEHKDKRLQTGVNNVADACKHLLSNKEVIELKAVSLYVDAHLGGKPALGTLQNDSKGVYEQVMTAYRACATRSQKQPSKFKDGAGNDQNKIYTKTLENRIKVLENVLNKNFKNQGVVAVGAMLELGSNEMGTVEMLPQSSFTTNQIEAISKLFGLLNFAEDVFDIVGKEGKERVVLKANKRPLLSPSELSEIKRIIGQ